MAEDKIRTGARTFLNLMSKACKLSHISGFDNGIKAILGDTDGDAVLILWRALCQVIEGLIAADRYFNQIDFHPEHTGDEDRAEEI